MDRRGACKTTLKISTNDIAYALLDDVFPRHTMMKPWINVHGPVTQFAAVHVPLLILLMRFAGCQQRWRYDPVAVCSLLIIRLQRRTLAK